MRNVLIAPDKFKGSLTALQAAKAIAMGWHSAHPRDQLTLLPISDGGDGFGEVLSHEMRARKYWVKAVDAAHRPCRAAWWYVPTSRTAIIESAKVIGLALLPPKKYHPFHLDTYGLGVVFKAARAKGALHCIVGIGGSATNDGGMGMARALGWKFLDTDGLEIVQWPEMERLKTIYPPDESPGFKSVTVAVDVQNRLLGARGCTRIYGPQKGIKPADFQVSEAALGKLATVAKKQLRLATADLPGAGAAGGLGFGLMTFAGATVVSGFEFFAQHAKLNEHLSNNSIVITGEGRIDDSTLMGKGVGALAMLCRKANVPCVGLAGQISTSVKLQKLFHTLASMQDFASCTDTRQNAGTWLKKLTSTLAARFNK